MSDRLEITGKGTVVDHATGLEWQAEPAEPMTWDEAMEYTEELDLGGYNDWRLPTRAELETLVDLNQYDPASKFPQMASAGFWSSSVYVDNASIAWHVIFNNGYVDNYGKYSTNPVRCVRRSA